MTKTKSIIYCGLFTALIAVGAFIKIPVPVAPIFKSYVGRRALTPPRWRSEYRTAGWGQPALQCLAPLPKGGLGGRIATASVRTDLAMTGFPWSVVHGRRATARVAPTEGYKEYRGRGDAHIAPRPLQEVR